MKNYLLIPILISVISLSNAQQWSGNNNTTDPISRTGTVATSSMLYLDGYNGAQIRLNSQGTYYGKIGNTTDQVWGLGWGGGTTDINPVLNWTASGKVGIGTTTPGSVLDIKSAGGAHLFLTTSRGFSTSRSWGVATNWYAEGDFSILQSTTNTDVPSVPRIHVDPNGKVGIGTFSPADQLEIVNGNRKVGFNTEISGVANGGTISLSRPDDGAKTMLIGTTASPADDNVIFSQGGSTELRLVSNGGPYATSGFGFYNNISAQSAFGSARPTPVMKIDGNGNLGIGTDSPQGILHIKDNQVPTWNIGFGVSGDPARFVSVDVVNSAIEGDPLELVYSRGSGVKIGTPTSDKFLKVYGTAYAKEVNVTLSIPGPDYVFEPNYKLLSLEEIKTYIDQHKHLPEVPSAKEMETNGVNVSEMNMILLKKIEELTLHVIELKNENIRQNKLIQDLTTTKK